MKKRFLSVFLALALCLGLTIPAFAAQKQLPEASFDLPDGVTVSEKTAAFQIRYINSEYPEDGGEIHTYDEQPASEEVTYTALPLATMITIGHMRPGDDLTYAATIRAYSDPDGDGIYDERLFFYDGENYFIIPLTEEGPFTLSNVADPPFYSNGMPASVTSITGFTEGVNGMLTADTDQLCQLFGPNTLIRVTMELRWHYKPAEYPQDYFWFLITGEGSPRTEPVAKPTAPAFTDVPEWCSAAVNWAVENGITNGTGNGMFSPVQDCTHAQILTFLWRAAGEVEIDRELSILVAEPYRKAILWADDMGMIDLPTFDPNASCTRADAVRYISQALLVSDLDGANSFTDVPADAPYAYAVAWAVENGVTNGYANEDGTFSFLPDKVCSRGEIVTFLHRAYVPEARLTASP